MKHLRGFVGLVALVILASLPTAHTSSPLAVYQGGTGLSSISGGALIYGSGGQQMTTLAAGSAGQVLTLMGGTPAWGKPDGCRVFNSAAQACASGAYTQLTFDSERYDSNSLHSTSSNTSRLTAATAGVYLIVGHVAIANNSTGQRALRVLLNGSATIAFYEISAVSGDNSALTISTVYKLSVSDYVEVGIFQNSGGPLNTVVSAPACPEFAMQWLGP